MSNLDTTNRSSGYEPLVGGQDECLTSTEDDKKTDTLEPQLLPPQSTVPTTPGFSKRFNVHFIKVPAHFKINSAVKDTSHITSASPSSANNAYKSLAGLATGILQIALGMIILFIDMLEVMLNGLYYPAFWAPSLVAVIYIVAGILGVVSRKQRQCVIVAYMVMSIVSAVFVAIHGASSIGGAVNVSRYCGWYEEGTPHHCGSRFTKITIATNATIGVFAFMEMVIAIVASAFCCHGSCSCAGTPTQTALVMYDPKNPDHQVVLGQVPGSNSPQNPN